MSLLLPLPRIPIIVVVLMLFNCGNTTMESSRGGVLLLGNVVAEGKGSEGNTTQCVLCGFQGRSLVQYSRSGCLLIKSLHTTIRHDSHVGMQYSNILLHHRHHYLTGVTHRSHLLIFRRRDQNQSLLDLLLFP